MKALLDSVSFSMAIQDVRYYLNGLFLQVNGMELIAVTTDGHRLCFNKIIISSLKRIFRIIIMYRTEKSSN